MMTAIRLIGVICLFFLASFTGSKIIKMAKIRGWVSSGSPISKVVSDRAVIKDDYGDGYWLAWDGADVSVPGSDRLNLTKEVWDTYSVGDAVEVLYFPDSKWPYHRDGIFASIGNFAFDGILLSLWTAGIVFLCVLEAKFRRKRRSQDPPKLPS